MASKTINELTLKLNADVAELKKDLAKAKGQLGSFQKGVNDIGISLKQAFTVGSIILVARELAAFGKEAVALGGQMAGVKYAFDKLNQPGLLDELREATKGTVSDLELMKSTVKASEFNIPIEKMATMMQFASMQGQKMGESVDYMVQSITTGLARGSVMILDNLGISAKELQEEMKKTGNMTDAAFNVINKKIAESGGIIETASTITTRWGARWQNMKANIGMLLNNALVKISPVLEGIANWFVKVWTVSTKFIIDTYNGYVDLYNESRAFRKVVESIGMVFTVVWETIKLFFNLFIDNLKSAGKLLAYVINPANWGDGFAKGLKEVLFSNANEIAGDIGKFGTNIGESLFDAINNTMDGQASYITIESLIGKGDSLLNKAKDAAIGIGQTIKKGISDGIEGISGIQAGSVGIDFKGIVDIDKLKAMVTPIKATLEEMELMFIEKGGVIIDASQVLQGAVQDGVTKIAEGFAAMWTGGSVTLKGIFDGFIGIIADFATSLGKQMVALGSAAIALKILMKNPITAIAAGAALIAIGATIRNIIAKGGPKFAQGGIVPGTSYSGDNVGIRVNSGEMILNKAQQGNLFNLMRGGSIAGGVLTARVSGNDLLFVLNEAKNKQSYSY